MYVKSVVRYNVFGKRACSRNWLYRPEFWHVCIAGWNWNLLPYIGTMECLAREIHWCNSAYSKFNLIILFWTQSSYIPCEGSVFTVSYWLTLLLFLIH